MTVKRGSDQCVCVGGRGGLDPALEMPCKAAFWPEGGDNGFSASPLQAVSCELTLQPHSAASSIVAGLRFRSTLQHHWPMGLPYKYCRGCLPSAVYGRHCSRLCLLSCLSVASSW
jgi:hypothetical protein